MSILSKIKNGLLDRLYALFGKEREDIGVNMRFSVITLISYRNIAVNKVRSFLTIGGVGIGIGIITFLISIGFGVQDMVIREITKNNPSNVVDVSNSNLENLVTLDDTAMEKIKNIEGVTRVERAVNVGVKFFNGETKLDSVLYGYTKGYLDMTGIRIKEANADFDDKGEQAFVTPKLAQLLGFDNASDIIGKTVQYSVIISGDISRKKEEASTDSNTDNDSDLDNTVQTESQGATIDNTQAPAADTKSITDTTDTKTDKNAASAGNSTPNNAEEKLDIIIAGLINDDGNNNTSIYAITGYDHLQDEFNLAGGQNGKVEVNVQADVNSIRSRVEQMGFSTDSVVDTVNDINAFFNVVKIVMVVFGTIIMSISAMGMLNTLSVSLLQRTREVGILKALGAKRADVFKMFIFEAAIISFSGGLLGFLSGYGAARGINALFNYFAQKRGEDVVTFISVPFYFIIAIVAFIAFLGFSTGIMPARRASKTHALDALRYE